MSLWGSITSWVDSALGTGGLITDVAVPIATTYMANQANKSAAKTVARGYQSQADAIREGNANAQARYDETQELTGDAVQQLRERVAGNPYVLTPSQRASLADTRLSASRTLNAGGLRGAGRSQLAVMRGVETDAKNALVDENKTERDTASNRLSGEYFNAVDKSAGLDTKAADAAGRAAMGTAETKAQSHLANVSTRGQALGDISAFLSNAEKEKARESRYSDRVRQGTV